MKTFLKISSVLFFGFILSACDAGKNKTNVELIQNMMDQESLKAQDYDSVRNEASNRVPPEGTVPRGKEVYMYAGDPIAAEQNLKNPLLGDATNEKWMARGAEKFRIYCSVCHGMEGRGDGTVADKMILRPPPLISDKVKAFRDGRIYHIITNGQGVMGQYASQISDPMDRWAIVNYIRTLQQKSGDK